MQFCLSLVEQIKTCPNSTFNHLLCFNFPTFQCDAIDGIDYESFISEPCIKFHFSNIDEKEMKNVNKRSCRTSKHVEL